MPDKYAFKNSDQLSAFSNQQKPKILPFWLKADGG